jgi:hypothetical protein
MWWSGTASRSLNTLSAEIRQAQIQRTVSTTADGAAAARIWG